ncbi:monooxygenase family protein [Roseobacter fucihabitans]|uniref:monooxygenase family protein n=1 Tax=Roseobacter fucihabitans TaxID=1537242 RepID=UPI001CA35233|nr:DUF4188 domain-containing protein [Roseobacter litoralis]
MKKSGLHLRVRMLQRLSIFVIIGIDAQGVQKRKYVFGAWLGKVILSFVGPVIIILIWHQLWNFIFCHTSLWYFFFKWTFLKPVLPKIGLTKKILHTKLVLRQENLWHLLAGPVPLPVWHETYQIKAGQYEAVYSGMPPFGLGKASELVPATGSQSEARLRLKG